MNIYVGQKRSRESDEEKRVELLFMLCSARGVVSRYVTKFGQNCRPVQVSVT